MKKETVKFIWGRKRGILLEGAERERGIIGV